MSDWLDNLTGVGNLPDNVYNYSGPDELDLQNLPAYISGADPLDLQNLPAYISGADPLDLENLPAKFSGWDKVLNNLKGFAGNALSSRGGLAAIMALLSALDRQKAGGGGTKLAYQGPRQYTRTVAPGAGGTPIARFAANGGLMQAYAGGGQVQMEDGGFVMTKKAVDGAGGPGGIQQLVPGARMIRGPGHGTSDSIPAVINGRNGQTPARLSNGEAYVPPGHDTKKLYALMHSLERKA